MKQTRRKFSGTLELITEWRIRGTSRGRWKICPWIQKKTVLVFRSVRCLKREE